MCTDEAKLCRSLFLKITRYIPLLLKKTTCALIFHSIQCDMSGSRHTCAKCGICAHRLVKIMPLSIFKVLFYLEFRGHCQGITIIHFIKKT